MTRALPCALALTALLWCCAPPPGTTGNYESKDLGLAFTLPQDWRMFGDEAHSEGGTLMNWQVKSLEGADPAWLKDLPESVVPQLQGWTRHFFGAYRDEQKETGTVGGEPALIVSHTVNVAKASTPSVVRYWVVRHGDGLYLIRAVYPAGREREEDPGTRELLGTWRFTPPSGPLPS